MNLLIDSAVKATAILALAWIAARALRRASADVRHLIWLIATISVATLPAALSIPQSAIPSAMRIVVPAVGTSAATHNFPWLTMIWAAGAAVLALRLIVGIARALRITRSARLIDGILYSDHASTPLTWGLFDATIVLPDYAIDWTDAQRDLVLRHEHGHVARYDWLWHMIASVITAVFWFHPLVWIANLQLRREAEAAVDDLVLSSGAAPADYASRLLDVARHLSGVPAPAAAIPMLSKPELETRVENILDPDRRRSKAGFAARWAIILAAATLLFPIALVHAQNKIYKIGKDVSQPSVAYKEEPEYTPEAKDAKIEGTVELRIEITETGIPENIRVTRSLDAGLDANAAFAVSHWRFNPAMKDGKPVAVYATIQVSFHLL